MRRRFAAMGVGEQDVRAMLKNQWYSLTVLTLFVNGLSASRAPPGGLRWWAWGRAPRPKMTRGSLLRVRPVARQTSRDGGAPQRGRRAGDRHRAHQRRSRGGSRARGLPVVDRADQRLCQAARPSGQGGGIWLTGQLSPRAKKRIHHPGLDHSRERVSPRRGLRPRPGSVSIAIRLPSARD